MNDLHLVYTLIDEGRVFYIGCTKNIYIRYLQHCRAGDLSPTYFYIQNMMVEGKMPEIKIVSCLPEANAYFKEAQLIVIFRECGHNLINDVRNFWHNKIHPPKHAIKIKATISKEFIGNLKRMQIEAIKEYNKQSGSNQWHNKPV